MAEQLKQNDSKIAYIVSSGNYHRKVYMTATCNSTRDIQTTTSLYTGTYHVDDDVSSGSVDISGTFSSTSTYSFYTDGQDYEQPDIETNPVYPFMTEQHGNDWQWESPNGQFSMQADASISTTQQTTTQQTYTTVTNQLYVLKSYSKTGIKVDITAFTTNASSKSTYSGTVGIYRVTSSSSNNYSNSNKTLLESYTTTSSSSNDLFYDSLISSSSRTTRYTSSSRSYYTYSRTDFLIRSLIASSIETQYKTTSLSEYNNQSYTMFTTNKKYTDTIPSYNVSNTYPYISFTTTGNIWNVTLDGYVNITTTSVPDYGTLSNKQEGCFFDEVDGVVHTYTVGKSYTSMLSNTTTFTSYVSSTTY